MSDWIELKGVREHNLKNISLKIPKNNLVVFTGLSGSGKSTLAFDTLHKEGQRQYLESLGLVGYNVSKPRVESIRGLSPSISVDQHLANRSPRSTVGTVTEVYTYLRVIYARLGRRPCPNCAAIIPATFNADAWEDEPAEGEVEEAPGADNAVACPSCGAAVPELSMTHFSFNKPAGACPTCTGLGVVNEVNLALVLDEGRSILAGGVLRWDAYYETPRNAETLRAAAQHYRFDFDPSLPIGELGPVQRDLLLHGVNSPQFAARFPEVDAPQTVRNGRFEGVVTNILRRYGEPGRDADSRANVGKLLVQRVCPDCGGDRLRPESRAVSVAGLPIVELSRLPLSELARWVERLPGVVSRSEMVVAEPVIADVGERIKRLLDVGVGYLTMERASPSLSAGEAQRLRLAALLGSGLTGVLYVLDEPTIGLHPRDTGLMIGVLRQLRDLGNTVLVVEHDLDVIAAADYVVDMGPGGGRLGGEVVVAGPPQEVATADHSATGAFLSGRATVPVPDRPRPGSGDCLHIVGARAHNLKDLTVALPLGTLTVVTGVSGSGKSSLVFDVLDRAARAHYFGAEGPVGVHDRIEGWQHLDKVITIDQSAIGRSSRSNAATYTDAFGAIREAFAATRAARQRGLTPAHFSFNVPGGRCERCEGSGVLTVNMHMLPDVQVRCPTCRGRRYRREVLDCPYRGADIAQVLEMTVEEAWALFAEVPAAASRLGLMVDVGLGYLQLGQPADTLSGGEAQRVKLAKELGRRAAGRTLYLLDEPTTGQHPADITRLLGVLQRLVDAGNTVVVIEHNLDLIRAADWVIDLGPEGGEAGGWVIAEGTPEQVMAIAASHTGRCLSQPRSANPASRI